MAINPNLLIAAPMLQDYLVDKTTGEPLANGIVTLYADNARSFLKNWYYQTGQPGAYSWVPLDNPMTLSSVGTIQDPHGNDVIPFYYPYDESNQTVQQAYYVTVYSAIDNPIEPSTLQFTRENFPFNPSNNSPNLQNPTWRNYIINNIYWRNVGSQNLTNVTSMVIAPSQHEGYTNGEISFQKNVTGATDSLSFPAMTATLSNDITPEFYLSLECTGATTGETQKCIQYPISLHVNTLASITGTIKIHAQNVAGNPNNNISLYFYQFLGTGAISQPAPVLIEEITLDSNFTEYLVSFITPPSPASQGLVVGPGGDDALFLQVQFPLNATFNINHTKPQIYFSDNVPTNDFDTYDQIESIINSPRTGDFRKTLNASMHGYVAANDGSIGSTSSGASTRANTDTWPLYNLLWNKVLNNWAPVTGGRGSTAIADFSANKPMTLTRSLGRVLAGESSTFAPQTFTTNYVSSHENLTVANVNGYTQGSPVQLINTGGSLPSNLSANTVYFIILVNPTTIQLASTVENAYLGIGLDIGSNQTGTSTIQNALGAYVGESLHTLLTTEMPNHNHTLPGFTGQANDAGGSAGSTNVGTAVSPQSTGFTGGGLGHNTIQPSTYVNVFIKL